MYEYENQEIGLCTAIVLSYTEQLLSKTDYKLSNSESVSFHRLLCPAESSKSAKVAELGKEVTERINKWKKTRRQEEKKERISARELAEEVRGQLLALVAHALHERKYPLKPDNPVITVEKLINELVTILSCSITIIQDNKQCITTSSPKRGPYFLKLTFYLTDTFAVHIPQKSSKSPSLLEEIDKLWQESVKLENELSKSKRRNEKEENRYDEKVVKLSKKVKESGEVICKLLELIDKLSLVQK
eukprot:TRINITY_DN10527_c0_g1_i2.p1 TRINITY_DN10527_c0_g1~~TRINITY_DN10527_c0_g1_i2.p1  ORF type:complete len:245 (+),score=50.60 TRINITY_DN10527_c0_g1_i2:382-1116(+)